MTIQHALSADGLAILALTARSLGGRAGGGARGPAGGRASGPAGSLGTDGANPLAPRDWARVARALASAGATPADLLGRETADVAALLGGAPAAAEAITRLAARATTLAMEVDRLAGRGVWLVSIVDAEYPARLRTRLGEAAPPILYGAGAIELLNVGGVAIVGARDADAAALEYAREAAAAVAGSGRPVVSGGARGIDAAAMTGAAEAGGSVVGAIADSLERKVRAADVRGLISDERLVLVSPYGADVPFSVGNAMGRNRLIYCLADAALVVSAAEGEGGTWAGATEALKAGWVPVYVRTGDGVPAGNSALTARGGLALEGGAGAAGELRGGVREYPEVGAKEDGADPKVAEQQTFFGGDVKLMMPRRPGARRQR